MSDDTHLDDKEEGISLNESGNEQDFVKAGDDAEGFDGDLNPDSWEEESEEEVEKDEDEDDEEYEDDDEDEDEEDLQLNEDEENDDESPLNQKGSTSIIHLALFALGGAAIIGGGGYYAYNQGMLESIFPRTQMAQSITTSPIPLRDNVVTPVSINASGSPVNASKEVTVMSKDSPLSALQPNLDTTKAPVSEMGFAVAQRDRSKIEEKADTAVGLAKESAEKIALLEEQIKSIESHLKTVDGQGKSLKIKVDSVEKVVNLNSSRYKSLDSKLKKLRIELDKESKVSIKSVVANELNQVSEKISGVLDSVSKVDDRVNSLEGKRREFTKLDSSNILFKMNGKERAIGFNVINATPDENMSVLLTPTRKVIIVFLGEKVIVDGKVRKVIAIEDGGYRVYFEGGYFVDEHRMEDFPAEIKKEKADAKRAKKEKADAKRAKNQQSQKKVEKKVQEIAKVMAKKAVVKMPATPAMPEAEPIVRQVHKGLSVVMVIEGNRFVLKTRDGLYIRAKEGHVIPGYEELGKIGVFITNKENNMNGILLIGEERFLVSK